jgi:hypothetical protein
MPEETIVETLITEEAKPIEVVKPIEEIKPEPSYLSEDEIKVILDIFNKLDLNLKDAKVILPIDKKLNDALIEPSLEPSQKLMVGYKKIELT